MKTPEFKIQQNLIASERNRRLTTYRGELTAMKDNQKPYPEMLHWLQQQGEECSTARLKVFFRHCGHRQKIENRWFEFTLSKAESDSLQEFLKNNPPPETATVIALLRHSILQQATRGKVTGESLKLTDRLARTLMTYELALKKLDQGERSLKLAEKRLEMGGGQSEGQPNRLSNSTIGKRSPPCAKPCSRTWTICWPPAHWSFRNLSGEELFKSKN